MAKDKLITVRIESEKREDFTKWAKDRSIDASVFLYGVIDACLDGRIDERILNNREDDKQLDKRIDERILKLENQLIGQLDNKLDIVVSEALEKAIAPFEKKLEEFDKGFQSLGATVHDHDRLLSQPIATKDELHKAITKMQTEIEDLRKTFCLSEYQDRQPNELNQLELLPLQTDNFSQDDQSHQGVTKTSLDPIFEDSVQGLSNKELSEQIGTPVSTIEKWKVSIKKGEVIEPRNYPNFCHEWFLKVDKWYRKSDN